jgi:hypothetical protein
MRLPNLLIVGAQKCGTTWLHSCLRKSGHVFGSSPKELNFFNRRNFNARLDSYAANFPEKIGATYYLESTPHYFRLPEPNRDIADRIRQTLDDPRIIVIFRNPVDRYESAVIHHMMKGRIPYDPYIDWIREDLGLTKLGRYAEILSHWKTIFPEMGVFFYDDIVLDPMSFVDSVFQFLSVKNDLSSVDIDFRTNDKDRKIAGIQIGLMQITNGGQGNPPGDASSWSQMPKLTKRIQADLRDFFREDVEKLETMTGRDLTSWKT